MKICTCGQQYDEFTWGQLRRVGTLDDGEGGTLELRNCSVCRSTMSTPAIGQPTMIPLADDLQAQGTATRSDDLRLLNNLLEEHGEELTETEFEAFVDMRYDLQMYGATSYAVRFQQLSDAQRAWVKSAHDRLVPGYVNLASSGGLARGRPTAESRALDAMLAAPRPLKPPGRH